jgi:hypothetical protein
MRGRERLRGVGFSLVVSALALLAADGVRAQTPMALRNWGQNIAMSDARVVGRGGWGIAEIDSLTPSFHNTASLVESPLVSILLTAYGERVGSEGSGEDRTTYHAFVPNARVMLPLIKRRLALAAGFVIRRSMIYETRTALNDTIWGDAVSGYEQFLRKGNLFSVPLGLSVKAAPGLSLGVDYILYRGSITGTTSFTYLDDDGFDSRYQSSIQRLESELNGESWRFSLLWSSLDWLRLGGSYTLGYDLGIENTLAVTGVSERSFSAFATQMPAELIVGGQVRLGRRWWFGTEYQSAPFGGFTGVPEWEPDMADEWTLSFGIERAMGRVRKGGWRNTPLRFGVSTRRWAYRIDGETIDEMAISIGTGFALARGMGQLDLALSYGQVGDVDEISVSSSYWRLAVSILGLEKWW